MASTFFQIIFFLNLILHRKNQVWFCTTKKGGKILGCFLLIFLRPKTILRFLERKKKYFLFIDLKTKLWEKCLMSKDIWWFVKIKYVVGSKTRTKQQNPVNAMVMKRWLMAWDKLAHPDHRSRMAALLSWSKHPINQPTQLIDFH